MIMLMYYYSINASTNVSMGLYGPLYGPVWPCMGLYDQN